MLPLEKGIPRRVVRVVCISDTHGKHDLMEIPPGDILIHAGDFTNIGTHNQLRRFASWLAALPHPHKVVVAGNHEYSLDAYWYIKGGGRKRHKQFQDPAISRQILTDVCTAFNLRPGNESTAHWQAVPDNVDILVTHTPPHGILDMNFRGQTCGDEALMDEVLSRIRPRFHVFGHIHEGHGTVEMDGTTFVNASSCNLRHQPHNTPIEFDISVALPL
ncbi:hypothetical protein B5M09_007626 [Aphanomyces astaci]|uniref:Calcineurin-like phosphoesterase domain-containing protein n=1 Tax=Aphanomyces astaci TaxID=112090 RepID=A0A425DGV0_APHAT|nr:hypothetical protein B5M09_007626 [Aphanomyces astaci]